MCVCLNPLPPTSGQTGKFRNFGIRDRVNFGLWDLGTGGLEDQGIGDGGWLDFGLIIGEWEIWRIRGMLGDLGNWNIRGLVYL